MKKLILIIVIAFPILVIGQVTDTLNYTKVTTYKEPVTISQISTNTDKNEAISYTDGLGRELQSISIEGGGNKENIIKYVEYDGAGKQVKSYLPYANGNNTGNYQVNALGELQAFYNSNKYENTLNPYSQTVSKLSASPKVLEMAAPGEDWKYDATNYYYENPVYQTITTDYFLPFVKEWDTSDLFNGTDFTEEIKAGERATITILNGILTLDIEGSALPFDPFNPNPPTTLALGVLENLPIFPVIPYLDLGNLEDYNGNTTNYKLEIQDNKLVLSSTSPTLQDIEPLDTFTQIDLTQNLQILSSYDAKHSKNNTIRFDYDLNIADEVPLYKVIFPTGDTEKPSLYYDDYYPANELYKTVTKDENWQPEQNHFKDHTTEEFKDKQGRVVLKRTFNNSAPHDTFYVYDDYGNLTYVMSPKGSDQLLVQNQYTAFNQNLIYDSKIGNIPISSSGYNNSNPSVIADLTTNPNQLSLTFNTFFTSQSSTLNTGPVLQLPYFVPDIVLGTINAINGSYQVSVIDGFLHFIGSGFLSGINQTFTVDLPDYSPDPNILNDLCYQYHYDSRNRLVEKKIPAKDWEYIVYDKLDRPVLTQDAFLRSTRQWLFTKYDVYNRVTYTGVLADLHDEIVERSAMQTYVDAQTILNETITSTVNYIEGDPIYYTNNVLQLPFAMQFHGLYTINYYDTYNPQLTAVAPDPTAVYGITTTNNTKSLPTGSRIQVLTAAGGWITTVTYYDDKAQPIYIASKNDYLNTTDILETQLDFTGKVLQTKTYHTKGTNAAIEVIDDFNYDHANRLLSQKQEILGEAQQRIVENHYDELGQLEKKDVGGETVFDGFTDIVGVEVTEDSNGNTEITKTASTGWDNAGIVTKGKFKGDGYVEFEASQDNRQVMAGLSSVNINENHNTMLFYIFLRSDGLAVIREDANNDGTAEWIKTIGSYVVGDIFRVERSGAQILYKMNGAVVYTSNQTAPTESLMGDTSLIQNNAKIKNLHVASTNLNTILQTVDYTYNIRGWLKTINDVDDLGDDLFGFKLNYNGREGFYENIPFAPKLYNGNIVQTLWKSANDNEKRLYTYKYDALNRIYLGINEKDNHPTNGRHHISNVQYDKNGNLMSIARYGPIVENPVESNISDFGSMDNLTYTYNGNQLEKVSDTGSQYGFKDGTNTDNDYIYDSNGNMTADKNKGITSIKYNHLNLPTEVVFNNNPNKKIKYIYDASGVKLKKEVNDNSSITSTMYAGNYIYEETNSGVELKFFSQPEGYIEPDNIGGYNYVYQYKDHLGNIRLTYSDTNNDGAVVLSEIIEENNYYPFGLKHKGYNNNVSANSNSVASKFKYNGMEQEEALGLNLYEMDMRQYDPAIARWTAIDPVTHFDYSTYSAFDNNPVFYADPSGADSNPYGRGGVTHTYGDEIAAVGGWANYNAGYRADTYEFFKAQEDPEPADSNGGNNADNIDAGDCPPNDPNCNQGKNGEIKNKRILSVDTEAGMNEASGMLIAIATSDGQLPFGDGVAATIGLNILMAYSIANGMTGMINSMNESVLAAANANWVYAKQEKEINRIMEKEGGPPGMVYMLTVNKAGVYNDVRGNPVSLNAGEVWRYGETTKGYGRYSQSKLDTMVTGGVTMNPIFFGNTVQIKVQEKIMIYGHYLATGSLPPGNKIFR